MRIRTLAAAVLIALTTTFISALAPSSVLAQSNVNDFYAVDSFTVARAADVEIDPETGYLWVTENGDGLVDVMRPDGSFVMSVGTVGRRAGELRDPHAISINDGEAFVADHRNGRIAVFATSDGAFLRNLDNPIGRPCAVLAYRDRVFVRTDNRQTLRVIDALTGDVINQTDDVGDPFGGSFFCFDADGSNDGNGIAARDGEIYIVDELRDRVRVYDLDLGWQRDIAVIASPDGIDIADDIIWITEHGTDTIVQYDLTGAELARFDLSGSGLGEIDGPNGIEVDPTGSTFWVTERANGRVQAFTTLTCDDDLLTIVGTSSSERIDGTPGDDVIHLGNGNDLSDTGAGDDTICGGDGDDDVFGGSGRDVVLGQDGADTLEGGPGNDELRGGTGNDRLEGHDGDDELHGQDGDDTVAAGTGDDDVFGGQGDDTLDGFDGIDTMSGGIGADKLFGGKGADVLSGDSGDDTIHGNRGADELMGGAGDDRIFGYSENDVIDGGTGDDRLHGNFGDDIVHGGDGNDRIFGYGDNDMLNGDDGDDLIGGNFGDDVLNGGSGNDTLYGSDGTDSVIGSTGDDSLEGNSGNDHLTGGQGNDALDGGINTDTCDGNSGTDTATRCETTTGVP